MNRGYGFIHDKLEIKVLLLFILRRLPEPVLVDELVEMAINSDPISYFDIMECVEDLVRTGHVLLESAAYSITEKGLRNGEITEYSLPFSVRTNAENAAFSYRAKKNRNSLIKTQHAKRNDGSYAVTMSLSDGLAQVISIEMLAVSEQQARMLEEGFRKNAEDVFNALISMIIK